MNLKHMSNDKLADLYLPDEALAALAAGQEWEFTPDTIEGADADCYYCDDCDTYHLNWSVWGLRLDADGTLYETLTSVDTDGDWSFVDEYPCREFDHDREREAIRARWRAYAEYVVRTGADPLNEFSSVRSLIRVPYVVRFSESIVGPKVTGVRRPKSKYAPLSEMPEDVKQFFDGMEEFKSMADLRERAMFLTWTGENRATFTIDRYPVAPSKADIRKRATDFLNR